MLSKKCTGLTINSDQIDQKAGWLLNSSNIIVGLFGLLQLTLLRGGQPCLYWVGVTLLVISYLALIWTCVIVLAPRPYKFPVDTKWETISQRIVEVDEEQAYATLISSYVEHIPHNQSLNEEKARKLRIAAILLAFIVALLVALGLVPR